MEETVGNRIERIAKGHGFPRGKALAQLLGVSYETLRKWKSGEIAPNRSRQRKIAEVLGADLAEMMFGAQKPNEADLSPEESRLIIAFRVLLERQKEQILSQVEGLAADIRELETRVVERQQGRGA